VTIRISLVCNDCGTEFRARPGTDSLGAAWVQARDSFWSYGAGPPTRPRATHYCPRCTTRNTVAAQGGDPDTHFPIINEGGRR